MKPRTALVTQRAATADRGMTPAPTFVPAQRRQAAPGFGTAGRPSFLPTPVRWPLSPETAGIPERTPRHVRRAAAAGVQGAGGELPHREAIQRSFEHHDVGGVRAYTGLAAERASKQIGAVAFATGERIAFARQRPDLFTTAHEAAHVVQQRAGVRPRDDVGRRGDAFERHADAVAERVVRGRSAADLLRRFGDHSSPAAAVLASPIQRKDEQFAGPTDAGGALINLPYPGYNFNIAGGQPLTGCAIDNWIQTSGEKSNSNASKPGNPFKFDLYRKDKEWDRQGGLVRDKNQSQAATKMHAVNHRIDDTWTQNDSQNIFMGTAKSNNPNHLKKVELPVIASLDFVGANATYETELGNAVEAQETTSNDDVLFWPGVLPGAVSAQAVKHGQLADAVHAPTTGEVSFGAKLVPKKKAKGVRPPATVSGQALTVDANTAPNNFFHAWVFYQITPNYPAKWTDVPQYVQDNWTHEDNANQMAKDATRTVRLASFKAWALQAFPVDFTAKATYYTASYKKAKPYREETEGPNEYSTDL